MTKVLRCNDLMPGCTWEGRGSTEAEVLMQAAEHAKAAHNLTEISPEIFLKFAVRSKTRTRHKQLLLKFCCTPPSHPFPSLGGGVYESALLAEPHHSSICTHGEYTRDNARQG